MKPNLTGIIFVLLFPKIIYKFNTNKNQKLNGFGIKMPPKQLVKNVVTSLCVKVFAFLALNGYLQRTYN